MIILVFLSHFVHFYTNASSSIMMKFHNLLCHQFVKNNMCYNGSYETSQLTIPFSTNLWRRKHSFFKTTFSVYIYLDGGFWEVEFGGELTPTGTRHIVLPEELLLEPAELLAGERRPVPADTVVVWGRAWSTKKQNIRINRWITIKWKWCKTMWKVHKHCQT